VRCRSIFFSFWQLRATCFLLFSAFVLSSANHFLALATHVAYRCDLILFTLTKKVNKLMSSNVKLFLFMSGTASSPPWCVYWQLNRASGGLGSRTETGGQVVACVCVQRVEPLGSIVRAVTGSLISLISLPLPGSLMFRDVFSRWQCIRWRRSLSFILRFAFQMCVTV